MWPQNFKKYVFEAENDLGSRTFEVTLKKGKQRQPLNVHVHVKAEMNRALLHV